MGKSTVAVNLAYELARQGGRIGLLDLDVYGPSLPVLVDPMDRTIRRSPLGKGMVYPLEHERVKMLSMGFVNQHVRPAAQSSTMDAVNFTILLITLLAPEWRSRQWRGQRSCHHERSNGCQSCNATVCSKVRLE